MSKCQFKIMNNNYITQSLVDSGHIIYSSETALKPFNNVFDDCRSTIWRPAGHFKIDSTNNKIYINGTTITLTSGNYTRTELVAHLNATLGFSITVSIVNDIFQFSSPGILTFNMFQQTNSIWSTLGLMQTTGNINDTTILADVPKIHDFEEVVLDLSVPTEVNFIAGIYLIDKDAIISNSAQIKIQADNLPDQWDSPEFEQTLQVGDNGFYGVVENQTYRYWRLEIKDQQNHLGYIELSNLYIGSSVDFHAVARGISRTKVDPSKRLVSESGSFYHLEKIKSEQFTGLQIQNMNYAERKKLEEIFDDVGISKPFFVSLDPFLQLSGDYSDYSRYVRFNNSINKQHLFLDYYTPSFDLIEVI